MVFHGEVGVYLIRGYSFDGRSALEEMLDNSVVKDFALTLLICNKGH